MPIVPVFSGDHYTYTQMTDLMKERDDPEKAAAVKAAFGQNLIDINNAQHVAKATAKNCMSPPSSASQVVEEEPRTRVKTRGEV